MFLTVPEKVRLSQSHQRRFKHGKPESRLGFPLGAELSRTYFKILDFLPRQHIFSWLIKIGCQQCFEITKRYPASGHVLEETSQVFI